MQVEQSKAQKDGAVNGSLFLGCEPSVSREGRINIFDTLDNEQVDVDKVTFREYSGLLLGIHTFIPIVAFMWIPGTFPDMR